jgi:hypothetical protein
MRFDIRLLFLPEVVELANGESEGKLTLEIFAGGTSPFAHPTLR